MRRFFQLTAIILFFQTSVFGLKVGDEIPLEALTELEIIQGEVPKEWGDKLYIVECWATWCGPCIQVIPHVNELYKKYQSKGLEVIGVNVLDDANKKQVGKFVEKQGEAMSYNVAFASKESIFVKDWFHASGAKVIETWNER